MRWTRSWIWKISRQKAQERKRAGSSAAATIMTTQRDKAKDADVTIMIDYEVYLEKLSVFGRLLREQGLDVTPAETADAAKILIDVAWRTEKS